MDFQPAFDGETFLGSADQLRALVSVSSIQPLFTTQRARPKPEGTDWVVWPDGECLYQDAAKFSVARLESLRLTAYAVAAHTYHDVPADPMDPAVKKRLGAMLRYMRPSFWMLPNENATTRKGFWHITRKDPVRDLMLRLTEEDVVGRFFYEDTQGYQEPVVAATGLENVEVHTRSGVLPWSQVGHIGEQRLSVFTLDMANCILACSGEARASVSALLENEMVSVSRRARTRGRARGDRFR